MEQKTQDLSEWLAGALDFGCFASVLSRLSAGQSYVLALHGPLGAAWETGIPRDVPGCLEAGVSRAALVQCAGGTKLSMSIHQHYVTT